MRISPSIRLLCIPLLVFALLIMAQPSLAGQPFSLSLSRAASPDTATPLIVVSLRLDEGYTAYTPDGGAAKPLRFSLLRSGSPVPFQLAAPAGLRKPDFFEPEKTALVYEGTTTFLIAPPSGEAPQDLVLSMLACSRRNCIPVQEQIAIPAPSDPLPVLPEALQPLIASLHPVALADAGQVSLPQGTSASGSGLGGLKGKGSALATSTLESSSPANAMGNALEKATGAGGPAEKAAGGSAESISGQTSSESWAFQPRFPQENLEPASLLPALLLGLLAGLILNVMPCVLPVLTMKISALLAAGGTSNDRERRARFREHNLLFAAGIVSWFIVLAFFVGGLGLAWGGLFQSSGLVFGLTVFVFLLALSLFDVFTLPVLDFKVGVSGTPRAQAYLTGLVATLLATPCSGPLLGGVLGWAALQPLPVILAVFIATGIGMASPYLVLAFWPAAARLLPRPGAWTGIMERLVGFFLMGTVLYLLSILPENLRANTLIALLLTALAAWLWGHFAGLRASLRQKILVGVLAAALVGGASWWTFRPSPPPAPWQSFSAQTFRAALGNRPLFVEFTADWCPSCKVLEHTVLTPNRLHNLVQRYGVDLVRVDLTRSSPEAEALLRALGSVSIPVAAIFPAGDMASQPIVLRDIYTADQLEAAFSNLSPRTR